MRLTEQNVNSILCIDGKAIYADNQQYAGNLTCEQYTKEYIASNKMLYTVVLNLYEILIKDLVDDRSSIEVIDFIKAHGLLAAIRQLADVAESFILCELHTDYWNEHMVHKILSSDVPESERVRLLLYVTTFFKKLSPAKTDLISSREINDLLATNQYNRMNSMSSVFGYWTRAMKRILVPSLEASFNFNAEGGFSSGSTAYSSKTTLQKITELSNTRYNIYDTLYPLYRVPDNRKRAVELYSVQKETFTRWYRDETSDTFKTSVFRPTTVVDYNDCCKLMAVPKTYKARRIIAPEPAVRAFELQRIRKQLEYGITGDYKNNRLKSVFYLEDQGVNQFYQQIGSACDELTTFDFSHASDLITHDLVWCITTPKLYQWLSEYCAKYLYLKDMDRCVPSWIFSTAGNPICFNLEGMIFSALALAVYDNYQSFTKEKDLIGPFVYGDDVIVDNRVADAFDDAATSIGWRINRKKTFKNGPYRESCGAESWKGIDISTKKWPRHEFFSLNDERQNQLEFANCLIEMQHRLYDVSWFAQKYLRDFVLKMFPRITISDPHTDTQDLWGPDTSYSRRAFPKMSVPVEFGEEYARYYCKYPSVETPKSTVKLSLFDKANLEMYVYTQYLQYGPLFDDPLLELLGVSTSRYMLDGLTMTGQWTLSVTERP